jgi:glycosyltransferase involved in cell wall biosynthesis
VKQQTITSEGISASKIIVVYNGLDTSAYKQDVRREVATIRKEYCVPEDALVVGVVAHYHREVKGLIYFVEAAGLVATEIKNVRFFLVGRGDKKEQERLIDRIRQLQLDGLFVFTGGQHNVVPFLSLFDVGVLPSLSEGLSNTLLEYMAVGLPVVATDVGGNREVIVDGRSGFLVKPALPEALAERILLLLRNPRLRSHIGEEAARTVRKRFSMETMIGQIQALYERLMRSQTPLAAAEFPNPGKHCWTFPPHGTTCNTAGSYLCAAAGSEQYQEKPKVNIHESDS